MSVATASSGNFCQLTTSFLSPVDAGEMLIVTKQKRPRFAVVPLPTSPEQWEAMGLELMAAVNGGGE